MTYYGHITINATGDRLLTVCDILENQQGTERNPLIDRIYKTIASNTLAMVVEPNSTDGHVLSYNIQMTPSEAVVYQLAANNLPIEEPTGGEYD